MYVLLATFAGLQHDVCCLPHTIVPALATDQIILWHLQQLCQVDIAETALPD